MTGKREIIKNMSLGFLPLVIYILADSIFGLTIGLMVAVGAGLAEIIYIYVKNGKVEYFILLDIGLLVLLGLISLGVHNDIFIKIKPALINSIILVLFYITAFTDNNLMLEMVTSRVKGLDINEAQVAAMKKMSVTFFYIFALHTVLILYAAFKMSTAAWGFISGGLFYILVALVVIWEWGKKFAENKILQFKYAKEEWFDLVDPSGNVIGSAPRSLVHGNPALLHPVVHAHVINAKGELFLQKRAENKQVQPGKWDTSVGGHVSKGESVDKAVIRETAEELNINSGKFIPLIRYIWQNEFESELVYVFKMKFEGFIRINKQEISDGRFWSTKEIEANIGKSIFTPNFEHEYLLLTKHKLL